MSDARLRATERQAATDGPEAQAALLRQRMRAGELSLERVEIAAYLGHKGARLMVPYPDVVAPPGERIGWDASFPSWLSGLAALPWWEVPVTAEQEALVRAAVAAGGAAWREHERVNYPAGWYNEPPELLALAAARAWIEEPTEERREAAGRTHLALAGTAFMNYAICVRVACGVALEGGGAGPKKATWWALRWIPEAARIAGEATVREAICAELLPWVLA